VGFDLGIGLVEAVEGVGVVDVEGGVGLCRFLRGFEVGLGRRVGSLFGEDIFFQVVFEELFFGDLGFEDRCGLAEFAGGGGIDAEGGGRLDGFVLGLWSEGFWNGGDGVEGRGNVGGEG